VERLITTYSALEWSSDEALVTKTRAPSTDGRRRFRNELRVNRLLRAYPPPVLTPALVGHDVQRRSLTFTAVKGEPLGPKYPIDLRLEQVDSLADIGRRLRRFQPERRWFRRLDSVRRLQNAHHAGLLDGDQASDLIALARATHRRARFAHGDLTARNVLDGPIGLTLIDWEWAGLYPEGYELAFLWFSLVEVEGGRARVEALADCDERAFLLSALLVQLWHLQWYVPQEFRDKHLVTRDQLMARLRTAS